MALSFTCQSCMEVSMASCLQVLVKRTPWCSSVISNSPSNRVLRPYSICKSSSIVSILPVQCSRRFRFIRSSRDLRTVPLPTVCHFKTGGWHHVRRSLVSNRQNVGPADNRLPKSARRLEAAGNFKNTRRSDNFQDSVRSKPINVSAEASRREEWSASSFDSYLNEEPLWLWVLKSFYSGLKGLLQFLWEQPGQAQQIEWPSFESTVKMALLTLVVVILLIVFLASVDSAFSYLLASSLRRVP